MQSVGLKRPHSVCEEEEASPECLLPVKDPYMSDDENFQHYHSAKRQRKLQCHKVLLEKETDSSQIPCENVKYLTYADFGILKPEVCLKEASVEECLCHVFKFMKNADENGLPEEQEKMVKKLYKDWEKDKDYSWIDQHDTCNFHQLSSEHFKKEIKNLKMFIEECEQANRKSKHSSKFSYTGESSSSRYLYVKFVVEVAILFEDLDYSSTKGDIKPEKETVSKVHEKEIVSKVHEKEIVSKVYEKETISPKEDMELSMPHIQNEDYSKEGRKCSNERSRLVKKILLRAAQLLPSVGCEFERGDDCKKIFPLVVQNADLCTDNRLLTDNVCDIAIQPTGVFTAPSKDLLHGWDENKRNYVWKLVVGVYDPSNETDSPSTTENDQNIDIGPPWSSELIRRDNWMNSSEFKTKIRQKIQSSVPQSCNNSNCLDKIAGEHLLQLFAMAHQRISMKEFNRGEFGTTAPGLFIVDHYVYFSRLCVSYPTMEYLTTGKCLLLNLPQVLRKGSKDDRPKVTFGNFCLDLTVANHRKAFVIFLQEFVLS